MVVGLRSQSHDQSRALELTVRRALVRRTTCFITVYGVYLEYSGSNKWLSCWIGTSCEECHLIVFLAIDSLCSLNFPLMCRSNSHVAFMRTMFRVLQIDAYASIQP